MGLAEAAHRPGQSSWVPIMERYLDISVSRYGWAWLWERPICIVLILMTLATALLRDAGRRCVGSNPARFEMVTTDPRALR